MLDLLHFQPPGRPGLPKGVGTRTLYDFSRSDTLDQSGNGYTLTPVGARSVGTVGGRSVLKVAAEGNDAEYTGSTSTVTDSGDVLIWAWVYLVDKNYARLAGRGRDPEGAGWSVSFEVAGYVSCSLVTSNPGYLQFTAITTGRTLRLNAWNFVACLMQNTYGAEPSHITAYGNGEAARTGLTGWSGLRTSTVGFNIYHRLGAATETWRTQNKLGALGVDSVSGLTEAQALARLYEVERVTRPYFTAASTDVLYIPSDAAASFPAYRAQRAQQHLMVR